MWDDFGPETDALFRAVTPGSWKAEARPRWTRRRRGRSAALEGFQRPSVRGGKSASAAFGKRASASFSIARPCQLLDSYWWRMITDTLLFSAFTGKNCKGRDDVVTGHKPLKELKTKRQNQQINVKTFMSQCSHAQKGNNMRQTS